AQRAQLGTVWISRRDVDDARTIVEGLRAVVSAIDELIADHEVAGLDGWLKAARGGGRNQTGYAELGHRPQVGAIVDRVRRDAVPRAVAREKSHAHVADMANRNGVAGRPVWRLDRRLLHGAVPQAVEARSTEDADVSAV